MNEKFFKLTQYTWRDGKGNNKISIPNEKAEQRKLSRWTTSESRFVKNWYWVEDENIIMDYLL